MRILMISPTSEGIGGIAQHVSKLAKKLRENNHEVKLVSSSNTPILRIKGLMNPTFAISASFKTLLRRYDIIHAHNLPSAVPMKAAVGRRVLTLHGFYSEQIGMLYGDFLRNIVSWFEKRILNWPDEITVVSKRDVEKYSSLGFKTTYIPNAIDLADIPNESKKISEIQITYVGRLSREKGVEYLIKAAEKIKNKQAKILIIGDGPEMPYLKSLAEKNRNIIFMGRLPREEALKYIKGSDTLVVPSLIEGINTAILEAMACGVPVIATNVGGNTEIITHMHNGILIHPKSPDQIAEAINLILSDESIKRQLTKTAYDRIQQEYNWDVVFKQYLKVYNVG